MIVVGVVDEGRLIHMWGLAAAKLKKMYPSICLYLVPDEFSRLFAIFIKTNVQK